MSIGLTPIERRLVAALDARAAQVTLADLRAPAPPTGTTPARRWLVAVVGMAAALVAVACFAVLAQTPDRSGTTRPLAPRVPRVSLSAAVTGPPAASPVPADMIPQISRNTNSPATAKAAPNPVSAHRSTALPGAPASKVDPPVATSSPTESPQTPVPESLTQVASTP